MAQQIGQRSRLTHPTTKPRRQFLQEATAVAEVAREILTNRFGQAPWIEQVCDGVRNAVQNGIENLSRTSLSSNAHPEDGYKFRARTREELLASQKLAANSGGVRAGKPTLDPAATELNAPAWEDEDQTKIIVPGQAPPPSAKPKGWIL